MSTTTINPILAAIKSHSAPLSARLAAAKGMFPFTNEEMLEALVALRRDPEVGVSQAAEATLDNFAPDSMLTIAREVATPPEILSFIATWKRSDRTLWEALIINRSTPDQAITELAAHLPDGSLLEVITNNQQRMIRAPQIMDAILRNSARTSDAERIVRQVQEEFFKKDYGARLVEAELGAQQQKAEAARRNAERMDIPLDEIIDLDIDDYILKELEDEFGPIADDARLDTVAEAHRIFQDAVSDGEDFTQDRVSMVQRLLLMNPRERSKMALRGDREARSILARDPNRTVSLGVLKNPRITEPEVEQIAFMKNAHEQVLRTIAANRAWIKNYPIMHNLIRNPRTPIGISLNILPRLQTRDARLLSNNKNVPDVIRKQAQRIFNTRMSNKN